jgi:superfamily II RNA helicase
LLARYNSIVKKLNLLGYLEDNQLTNKGEFTRNIFADEFAIGEIFATEMVNDLDNYEILLLLGALVYEERRGVRFKQKFVNKNLSDLKYKIKQNSYLKRQKNFLHLEKITTLIYPLFNDRNFFDILEMTNLLEGDLIRFYGQINDRLNQIRKASYEQDLTHRIEECMSIISKLLKDIYNLEDLK